MKTSVKASDADSMFTLESCASVKMDVNRLFFINEDLKQNVCPLIRLDASGTSGIYTLWGQKVLICILQKACHVC